MPSHPAFTVIIPAHNEEAVIGRCLAGILQDAPADHRMEIIVAANGCSDRTVEIAREVAPQAIVLDIAEGSKTIAMNTANKLAKHFPRIYLDADVQCGYWSLLALAKALGEPGVMAASPALRLDLSRSNALMKAYYRVWMTQPYVKRAMVGSGCFGISSEAYERIGDFPEITADDFWVHSRFAEPERRSIARDENDREVFFVVSPPRRAIDQIRVETRRCLGNLEVLRDYPSPYHQRLNRALNLVDALKDGASLADIAVYLTIKMIVRLRAAWIKRKSDEIVWERDLLARMG
jgi:glycosyltransferase involved in cell wall biosynthesis